MIEDKGSTLARSDARTSAPQDESIPRRGSYAHEAVLRDGTSVAIREVTTADREAVRELFTRMGPVAIRHRFFAAKKELVASDLAW
ncbi:MAG: hypothetical protein ACM31C_08930, partial [Acidobacteriota bacterium]